MTPTRQLLHKLSSQSKFHFFHNPSPETTGFGLSHVHTSLLLKSCATEGHFHLGSSLHASIIKNYALSYPLNHSESQNALVVWNSLLSFYSKCGGLKYAGKVFDDMPVRDTISWNSMIFGVLRNGEYDAGFGMFVEMRESVECMIDKATITTVLSACNRPELCYLNKMVHSLVFLYGYEQEVAVGNALITSYFKCGCHISGRRVFDEMIVRNVVTWTATISGLARNQLYEDSLKLLVEMRRGSVNPNSLTYLSSLMACTGLQELNNGRQIHGLLWKLGIQADLCIESALMDMHAKCGSMNDACQIFEFADEIDEVSMTVILSGFAQNGLAEKAIEVFMKMMKAGMEIDPNTLSAVLGVIGVDTSLGLGKQIHSLIVKKNFNDNSFIGNGLINMYSKCGDLEESMKVFLNLPQKNSVSWNSMIAAFARHGDGCKALKLYEEMIAKGVRPTDVTFISLLHTCSHVGLVDKGMEFCKTMVDVHGLRPRTEHYVCVVDMLGRAGLLREAKSFIEGLSVKINVLVWQALLGACRIHCDLEMGKYAADQLFLTTPDNPAPYVVMANMYSSVGRWDEQAKTIEGMKENGVVKEMGVSWIEIDREVHSFVAGDKAHKQAEIIYEILAELTMFMLDEGDVWSNLLH